MTDSQAVLTGAVLCVVGIGGSALCSGLETGYYALNRIRLKLRVGKGDKRALRTERELAEPDRLLTTLLIWNNIFNYLGSLGLTAILLAAGFAEGWVIVLQALVLTPMLLIFAESLPKELFRVRADDLPYRLASLVRLLRLSSLPVLAVVLWFARRVARAVGAGPREVGERRRIASLLKEGVLHGAISPLQVSLIDDAMELAQTPVGDLGVPTGRLACVSEDASREQFLAAARKAGVDPVVILTGGGAVASLLEPLDIGLGRVDRTEPVRIEAGLGARDALAEMASRGVRAAVLTRNGRDIGVVTTRRTVRPLLRSIRTDIGSALE
jgi:magnesium and cobalt exporter, CNNM family